MHRAHSVSKPLDVRLVFRRINACDGTVVCTATAWVQVLWHVPVSSVTKHEHVSLEIGTNNYQGRQVSSYAVPGHGDPSIGLFSPGLATLPGH